MGDAGTIALAADALKVSAIQTNTGAKTFNNQTLVLRNPANTFSSTVINPTITANANVELANGIEYEYILYKDPVDSNYKAKKDGWLQESSNSDALTVLNYAITNSERKGAIGIKGGISRRWELTGKLDLINKNVAIFGLSNMASSDITSTTDAQTKGGVVFKKNYATAEPFIDLTNTAFCKTQLKNIAIIGNNTTGDTGIKAYDVRERFPFLDNVSIDGFDTGMELSKTVYCDIYNLSIAHCATQGLLLTDTLQFNNTLNFYGGKILANPTDIKINANSTNDVNFFGTRIEGASSGYVNGVNIAQGADSVRFMNCSFEKNQESNHVVILDAGNNNVYAYCRFTSDVNMIPIRLSSTARNIKFENNFIHFNAASLTHTITIDAGATNTLLIGNQKGTDTTGTITLSDAGSNTVRLGNAQAGISDQLPAGLEFGTSGTRIMESGTSLIVRDPGNTVYRNFFANAIATTTIRTTTSIDNIATGGSVTVFLLAAEDNVVTAPADPAANKVRRYAKQVDANNDGWFIKTKVNGAVQEIRIA